MTSVPPVAVAVDVSYSVKELFEKVDRKLDHISAQIDGKADRTQVVALEGQIEALKSEIADIKIWRAKVAGVAAAVGAVVGGSAATVAQLLG